MAVRISEYVLAGELRNTTRNSVAGWIEFAPDWGVWIELNGNFQGQFAGKHLRFRNRRLTNEDIVPRELPDFIHRLADRQIGVIGDLLLQEKKIPTVPAAELMNRQHAGKPAPYDIKDVLYIEWYGPNGRVVAEMIDPEIELITDETEQTDSPPIAEPLDDSGTGESGPSITSIRLSGESDPIVEEPVVEEIVEHTGSDDDEYGLFDGNLEQQIRQSLSDSSEQLPWEDGVPSERKKRSWDEVIPGIDPETKAIYEQWDEIYDGEKEEPVTSLFDPPLQLPAAGSVTTDEDAEPILSAILGRLAMLNVAFDLCEHATPLTAYRCLVEEVLPTAQVHPNLADTDIVEHYCMYEYCADCKAEFDES